MPPIIQFIYYALRKYRLHYDNGDERKDDSDHDYYDDAGDSIMMVMTCHDFLQYPENKKHTELVWNLEEVFCTTSINEEIYFATLITSREAMNK